MNRRLFFGFVAVSCLAAGALPAAGQQARPDSVGAGDYIIPPGDQLRIRVWPDSALGGEFPVEFDGTVALPILGSVLAADVPLSLLRATLREGYGAEMRAPIVTVTPLFDVGVLGAVNRPGLYEADPSMTVFDVISMAGGFADNAKEDEIRLIRSGSVIEINGEKAIEEGASTLALALQSGDRVMVPRGRDWRLLDLFYGLQAALLVVTLARQF